MTTTTRIEVAGDPARPLCTMRDGLLVPRRLPPTPDGTVRVALLASTALLLAGDQVRGEVVVGEGHRLEVVETTGTVAYAMRGGSARWDVSVGVATSGTLAWSGLPFVVADGADVRRSTEVDLARDATAAFRESLVLGRSGQEGGHLEARTRVRLAGRPLLVESLVLDPVARQDPTVLAGARCLDTVSLLGARLPDGVGVLQLDGESSLARALVQDLHRSRLDGVFRDAACRAGRRSGKNQPLAAVVMRMTSSADRTIAALRSIHDQLAGLVPSLSDDQLTGPSGAADWTVAQVLSHLGSGAEIARAGFRASLDGEPAPDQDVNVSVWDRWNAMSPRDQADGFLVADAATVETLEALSPEQREGVEISLGFVPEPVSVAVAAGLRLNEAAQHAWDVNVALDPAATVDAESAETLLEHLSGGLGFMLGWIGKADQVSEPAVVALSGSGLSLVVDGGVTLSEDAAERTATFSGAPEAVVRLIGGRLTAEHTPADLEVTGNISLEDLRRVFPGF